MLALSSQGMMVQAKENKRAECVQWETKLSEVSDVHQEGELSFKSGKSEKDLMSVFKTYPDSLPYSFPETEPALISTRVKAILEMPGCADITLYDLMKMVIESKSLSKARKKEFVRSYSDRMNRQADSSTSLIGLILNFTVIDKALDAEILSVSDAAYYPFIAQFKTTRDFQAEFRTNQANSIFKCTESGKCTDASYEAMYSLLRKEYWGTRNLQLWLAAWSKRVLHWRP